MTHASLLIFLESTDMPGFLPFGTVGATFVDDGSFVLRTNFNITLFEKIHENEEIYVSWRDYKLSSVVLHYVTQISSNGFISFNLPLTGVASYSNEPFSEQFTLFSEAMIAPLWTDLVIYGGGGLYYRTSTNISDLNAISELIASASSMYDYHPTHAVIVTWESASLFSDRSIAVSTYCLPHITKRNTDTWCMLSGLLGILVLYLSLINFVGLTYPYE